MFADDTTLIAFSKSVPDVEIAINYDLANVLLNLIKTEYQLIGSRHNINNRSVVPNVFVGDVPIK